MGASGRGHVDSRPAEALVPASRHRCASFHNPVFCASPRARYVRARVMRAKRSVHAGFPYLAHILIRTLLAGAASASLRMPIRDDCGSVVRCTALTGVPMPLAAPQDPRSARRVALTGSLQRLAPVPGREVLSPPSHAEAAKRERNTGETSPSRSSATAMTNRGELALLRR